ncbi:GNAT family N-acetyltransferase [Seonamhaeicola sp. S2-3]|uniref:GNAT family N-acetyltransferase n=1 Tax=Seonamhaeicola sp. S2-3 TaxID=1936081 RepID=UPI000972A83A|nr:GNAT family N-acetyltransferase [Seonamhaeicola sp. S2-3]APY12527.1 GNAT family N-acetyltransferase [Seonamhaeicola sp. S2-3]
MTIPTLENNRVKLTLLGMSNYKHLIEIAKEPNLVQYSPSKIDTPEALKDYVQTAVDNFYNKTAIPFIIFDKQTNLYAGCTRFGLINWHNKVLHIGWTWIGHQFQGTGLNKQVKYLMLKYVFETLKFDKVEFRADERNIRSRKAIENIGGTLEGILRKDTLMLDGFKRSTCCYGILKEEWGAIKKRVFE